MHIDGNTLSMTTTTIKVSRETRDLLKEQAAAQRTTLDGYLRTLAEEEARRERMRQWAEAVRNTPADVMEEYHREAAEWDRLAGDGLENLNDDYY